jgi:hypothetical protein
VSPEDRFFNDHDWEEWSGEIGGDYSRKFVSGWRWRLIGLTTFYDWTKTELIDEEEPVAELYKATRYRADESSSETIFRTTLGKNGGAELMPEFGVEGALNTLESSLEIRSEDGAGQEIFFLPVSPVRVEELRAEAFSNLVWRMSGKVSLDGGVKYEVSRISSSGAADQAQTFRFLKPSFGLTYAVSDNLQVGLSAERSVGQLDFSDFAASADATDDRVIAGNQNLSPDRTDRLEGTLDYQFGKRGAFSVELFYEWKDDVLERILMPSGGQARANVGNAKRWGLEANATLTTDEVLKGGLLEIEIFAKDSSFLDPLTGEARRLHDFTPLEYYIDFRHDIPSTRWAWGVEYDSDYNWHGYYVDEFEDFEAKDRWDAYVETAQFLGAKMRLSAFYIGGVERDRIRYLYEGTRGGALTGTAISERTRDLGLLLAVSGQF